MLMKGSAATEQIDKNAMSLNTCSHSQFIAMRLCLRVVFGTGTGGERRRNADIAWMFRYVVRKSFSNKEDNDEPLGFTTCLVHLLKIRHDLGLQLAFLVTAGASRDERMPNQE